MKLVMTLIARDESDIVDAQVAFHLNAGVDFVVATDHASVDGTTEILRRYEREGYLRLLRREGDYHEAEWRTEMARLAATEIGADWVFASDADEFWWPRGPSLRDVLDVIPARYGIVRAFWRPFVPRPDDGAFFAERMTVRLSSTAPINDPLSQWRPNSKVMHRARPDVVVGRGNHAVEADLVPLRGWFPVEVLHFPHRSREQFERKASVWTSTATVRFHEAHRAAHDAVASGGADETYDSLVVADEDLERGLAAGSLVVDERLRDALRTLRGGSEPALFALPAEESGGLRFPFPSVVEDAAYAVDVAVLGEADVVRAQRHLDELEQRLAVLERRPSARLARLATRLVRRTRRST
ncbi:MAG TPA: glycosyltransferase family 2 protein [Gaiellaceae bacterium]|nr:glycosyltransferase family 2 protein [Gaiellaceae bacterium]